MRILIVFLFCILCTAAFGQATYDVLLTWDKHLDTSVTKYSIYRHKAINYAPTAEYVGSTFIRNDTTFEDYGLEENYIYYYWATATSEDNIESDFSAPATIHAGLTSIEETAKPQQFNLYQNYPNPFNPSTQITFDLAKNSHVTLYIYDVNGRVIIKMVDKRMQQGQHTVRFEGSLFSSGIYFYALQTESFSSVKKMILIE